MTHPTNELGQPIGHAIEKFNSPARPNFMQRTVGRHYSI